MQQLAEIEGISGVHLMAFKQEEFVGEIVHASGVLGGRKPWSPTSPLVPTASNPQQ